MSVWSITGVDNQPRTTSQVLVSSIGLFLGAVINANIFGELALVINGINKNLKKF